jgi:predicted DCC family thiol-disulfide oxidoreductase YuxK
MKIEKITVIFNQKCKLTTKQKQSLLAKVRKSIAEIDGLDYLYVGFD